MIVPTSVVLSGYKDWSILTNINLIIREFLNR
jgi:hypothetical protein